MWFNNLKESDNPGRQELEMFVWDVKDFLNFVLEDRDRFGFLWESDPSLYKLAVQTYRSDVAERGVPGELIEAIPYIPPMIIRRHGLEGLPLMFKFRVINTIADKWGSFRDKLSMRAWFKKLIDAIDALLNSLIDAAGGAGGLIKEFKDALRSLA